MSYFLHYMMWCCVYYAMCSKTAKLFNDNAFTKSDGQSDVHVQVAWPPRRKHLVHVLSILTINMILYNAFYFNCFSKKKLQETTFCSPVQKSRLKTSANLIWRSVCQISFLGIKEIKNENVIFKLYYWIVCGCLLPPPYGLYSLNIKQLK